MKKFITTAGIAALGAAGVQGAWAPGASSTETTKPWSVAATLRGFYDDNYATRGKGDLDAKGESLKRSSYGFEVSPSAALNIFREQTSFGLSYVYSMRYYDDRPDHKADHSHQVNAKISHAFSPRFKLDANDSFVVAQEPALLDPNLTTASFIRTDGDNMRNTVGISFTAGITEKLESVFTYTGTWYDYDQEGPGSRSALLDRWEHLLSFNLRRPIFERTVGILGYQYGIVDYNSKDSLALAGAPFISSNTRDNHSHYGYLGVDQTFSPTLNASVRGGVQYTEYDNITTGRDHQWGPYVDANATWAYTQGSYAQLGVRHNRIQTDVGVLGTATPNQDAETTTVYGSVNHRFGPFVASLIASYQHADLSGGPSDGLADDYFQAGINLTYEINKFLAAETGYNYDNLDSELNRLGFFRSFSRNRVYIGIRATY